MALARQTVATAATLRTRVRREVGDPDTDVQGNTIVPQKYSNDMIDDAIDDALVEMSNVRGIYAPSTLLRYVDLTLSDGEADLPSALALNALMLYKAARVLDLGTDPIDFVSALEIERYNAPIIGISQKHRFTIIAASDPTVSTARFVMRPKSNSVVRLWYKVSAILPGATSDSPPDTLPWIELIALLAAWKLLSIEERWTSGQELRLRGNGLNNTGLWGQFLLACASYGGPKKVRDERKFRT